MPNTDDTTTTSSDIKDDLEIVRMLLEQAMAEAKLMWQRFYFLVILNGATLTIISPLMIGRTKLGSGHIIVFACVVAIVFNGLWWFALRKSRFYVDRYFDDARNVCLVNTKLQKYFANSLFRKEEIGFTQLQSVLKKDDKVRKTTIPTDFNADNVVRVSPILFFSIWVIALFYGSCR